MVSWAPLGNITQGTPLSAAQLNAVANVQGTFSYNPGAGTVPPVGTRRLTATFSPNDASDYAPVTANNSLTIDAASAPTTPAITWPVPAAITYGTALGNTQLDAMANVSGSFAYTPSAGTVLKTGRQTLNAVFTPSDTKTYSAATASVQLTINPAAPIITWGTPNPITVGTALGATQLGARASVPGSFTYSPAAGAVLATGTHQLTVAFSPADASDYSGASAYTSLVVNASSSGSGGGPANPAPTGCGGPTIDLNSSMSRSALQSAITNAPNCALIVFAAGTYNINSTLTIPCNKLTITGPVASPATAVISGSLTGQAFSVGSNCSGVTIEYLHTQNIGILSTDTSNNSNINILHNQCTNIQGDEQCLRFNGSLAGSASGGQLANTVSNVTIEYNTFGDPGSCTAQFAATPTANAGGNCAGVIVGVGEVLNWTVEYNFFNHVEEGFHILNLQGSCCKAGVTESVMVGFTFDYNYVLNWHRIAVEIQAQTPTNSAVFENNVLQDPQNMYWETYGWSFACCQNSFTELTNGFSPGLIYDSNVVMAGPGSNSANGYAIQMGTEFWGTGAQGTNNLMQGSLCTGINWGFGAGSWAINNNTFQGPLMAAGKSSACPFGPATYISNEEGQSNPPSQSGNVTGASTSAITSVAPTMSPASGGQTFPLTVTLTDAGHTSGAQPLGNTGIWYTTDGSTPVPGSGAAQYLASGGTFVLPAPATVKAVGMWGTPNQPTSYPAGYGFVPSGVVTAAYSVSGAITRPAGTASSSKSPTGKLAAAVAAAAASAALESVAIDPSQPVVAIGSTTQLKAVATFNDGSVKDVTAEFNWQSSDTRTIVANESGLLAALATGPATISGSYQGVQASVAASSAIGQVDWSGPIVITAGGTYTGNWQSTDSKTPAVTVATTDPVTIENSHIQSAGSLIKTSVAGSNLTVRNSLGMALNAAVKGQPNGNFLEVTSPARLDVENNYVENAQGAWVCRQTGWRTDDRDPHQPGAQHEWSAQRRQRWLPGGRRFEPQPGTLYPVR